jgi:maltooligosyltrehalose trehalohydrolase
MQRSLLRGHDGRMRQASPGTADVCAARRYPIGAESRGDGVAFRVWAPKRKRVAILIDGGGEHELRREPGGYFSATVPEARPGARYRFRLDNDRTLYPDPASRLQPDGPHGASQVIDPRAYAWQDDDWRGVKLAGQVIYELHVGTFTPQGTWRGAMDKLPLLKELGITLIEMMPVNEFPGRFGWGYDGVNLFAPTRLYGSPDDLRRFVDAAHRLGMGVILDVVYNHLGPDGNYHACFSDGYFTDRYENEWGEAINFDGDGAEPVRDFFTSNAAYWVEEFHFDGLRLDATQSMHDASDEHVIAAIVRAARAAAGERSILVVAENEPQHTRLVRPPARGGYGVDALWNDDFHHSAIVALTGRNEAYYEDHQGVPQEFVSAAKYGYLFQGQYYAHQGKRRGMLGIDLAPAAYITFIENHDQVANSPAGLRLHRLTSPGRLRAMTALFLLMPGTPMLFQGQEFAASAPFLYFADHNPELAPLVREGRHAFLRQFPSIDSAAMREQLADPGAVETFDACKLDWSEFDANKHAVALHRDLLRLRREDAVFAAQGAVDGAVLGPEAFVLRFFGREGDDRLMFVNLGRDLTCRSIPDPLVAPPENRCWRLLWASEHPDYGGGGIPEAETRTGWRIPGHSAVVLAPAIDLDSGTS